MPRRVPSWSFLLWALASVAGGCASPSDAEEGEPPRLHLVVPADYPYGARAEAAPVESATIPRVLGWSDATHVRSVDRLVPTIAGAAPASEVLRFGEHALTLEGDPAVRAAVAAFLADRRRFDDVVIELEAELSQVDLDDLPPAGEGAVVQVPTASAALALAVEAPPGSDVPGVGTYRALLVLRFGEHALTLEGDPAVRAAVAAFLADRRRFDDVVIELEAELSQVDLDDLPPAGEGAVVQVPTASAALALAVEAPPGSDVPGVGTYRALLVLNDGETATVVDRAPLAAIQHPPRSDAERILGLGPFAGYSIRVQPALAEEGRVLAGWLEAEVGSLELSRGERVEVWGARGPRIEHELVTLRFALRPGETLWVLMDRPGARDERAALALRLRWVEAEAHGREEERVEEAEPAGD